MQKIYLLLCLISATILTSCNDESGDGIFSSSPEQSRVINKSGSADGVNYSLKNLSVNPDLVKITSENATITSSENEIKNGVFSLEISSDEIKEKLIIGNVIYVQYQNTSYLRKISSVNSTGNSYSLETTEAYIGDLFNGGSLELSVDTQQAENARLSKSSTLIAAKEYNNSFTFDIFNHIQEYKYGGMTFTPNTFLSSVFTLKIGFGNSKLIPNEVVAYYELNTSLQPEYTFNGAVNKKFSYDLIDNVPANLLEQLKKIEIEITIPTGDFLGDIPAKVNINEIKFPVEMETNISKASHLAMNSTGKFKIGFAYYNGVAGKTSHFIYENSMSNSNVADADLNGEVISDMKIVIIPKVTLFDTDLLDVNGTISFGLKTFSAGNGSITQPSAFTSKGDFYSSGTFSFGTLGLTLYTTELFKDNKELWNIGSFNKTMTVSNFRTGKASILPCSGLTSFSYTATVDYKYPISGKMLSGNLEMTYDVYSDNGTLLESGKTVTISPSNITADSFSFSLCVPFRRINILSISKTSYLRNITIKDANGYTSIGIIDPTTGKAYTEIKLTR